MPQNRFAVINGLPEYGERAKVNNSNINDIITYKVEKIWIYSVVIGITPTCIRVIDLDCEITENCVNLTKSLIKNITTDCLLKDSRRIFKINNITYL